MSRILQYKGDQRIKNNPFDNDYLEMLMHLWQYQKRLRPTLCIFSILSLSLGKSLTRKLESLKKEDRRDCFNIVNDFL